MKSPRVQIGIHADHDMRQFAFERQSGLSLDYFRRRRLEWPGVGDVVMVVLAIAVIVALATGVLA